jgi:hypothetical protein
MKRYGTQKREEGCLDEAVLSEGEALGMIPMHRSRFPNAPAAKACTDLIDMLP